jgi:hypothetical protein
MSVKHYPIFPVIVAVFFLSLLTIRAGAAAPTEGQTQQLTIVHTNDCHGNLTPYTWVVPPFTDYNQPIGGLARRAYMVKQLRSEITHPLALVDAGDAFLSNWWWRFYGVPDVAAMNLIGYDAMAVGNHELDTTMANGIWTTDRMLSLVADSNFPWLSANLKKVSDGTPFSQIPAYTIKDYGGFKVGFLGLTVPDNQHPILPECNIESIFPNVNAVLPTLRSQCDVVIAVTHLEINSDGWDEHNTRLIQRTAGIDAIVTGHSHETTPTPVWVTNPIGRQVPIVSTGCEGILLGKLDLTFTNHDNSWQLTDAQENLIPLDPSVPDDPEVAALVDSYINQPPHGPVANAVYTSNPPIFDGNLEEWNKVAPMQFGAPGVDYQLFGAWTTPPQLSATAWLAWDPNYLYCAVDFTDQTILDNNLILSGGGISLLLDPLFDRSVHDFAYDDWLCAFNKCGDTTFCCINHGSYSQNGAPYEKYALRSKPDGNGLTLEVAFAWSDLGTTPANGKEMGWAWQIGYYGDPNYNVSAGVPLAGWGCNDASALGQLILRPGNYTPAPTLTTAVNPPGAGAVNGGGTYTWGETATLQAIPAPGYWFIGWGGEDLSGLSNPDTLTMDGNKTVTAFFSRKPSSPTSLTAAALSSSQIKLDWSFTGNVSGFRIFRKIGDGVWSTSPIKTVGNTVRTFTNTGLKADSTYTYAVAAYNSYGNSLVSNEASATTMIYVAAPTTLIVKAASATQVNLTWIDKSTNETGFSIERRLGTTGAWAEAGTVGAGIKAYADSSVDPNTLYNYRLRATAAGAVSAYSNIASVKTPIYIAAPTDLTATSASTTSITLSWTDNATNETGYKIERKLTTATTWTGMKTTLANVTSFTNTGLVNGRTYVYRVRAYRSTAYSGYSNEATATAGG